MCTIRFRRLVLLAILAGHVVVVVHGGVSSDRRNDVCATGADQCTCRVVGQSPEVECTRKRDLDEVPYDLPDITTKL